MQLFDSLAVDGAGNICVGTLVNGGVTVVAPDGSSYEHLPMPDMMVTNICFGGPDLTTAYVAMSGTGQLGAGQWSGPGLALAYTA
jgi:gluconolactonase